MSAPAKFTGRCGALFLLGVLFDILGVILLLIGIFGSLQYFDFFIYTGAIVVALSLVWWSFWYTVNIEVSEKEILGVRAAGEMLPKTAM